MRGLRDTRRAWSQRDVSPTLPVKAPGGFHEFGATFVNGSRDYTNLAPNPYWALTSITRRSGPLSKKAR